jgi:energy-coupling factor transporter ATP-binding protein EcfA2
MAVLQEILTWSQDRPAWQRDALRRLALNGELTEDDIRALTELCKSKHGLAESVPAEPLDKHHIPDKTAGPAVWLASIHHLRGVNALAEDQTLKFAAGLTVVYGDNGAGKSGYTRILKSACRARGQEKILGNVVAGTTPLTPVVSIKYRVGDDPEVREWVGGREDALVSRVSVFDTQSAAVYLTEKTDVAFRPFGLDLFDKLVQACKAVRARVESDQRALGVSLLTGLQAQVPNGTSVARLLAGVSSLTKPETVHALALLSAEEEARLDLVEKSLLDLQANDPEKLIQQLTLRQGRVNALVRHLKDVEGTLSDDAVQAVFEAQTEGRRKSEEAKRLREATFTEGLLTGTGADAWKSLWEAARRFSEENAYPGKSFPAVSDEAQCVLCQQELDHAAAHRFQQFESFVASTTERELRLVRQSFAQRRRVLADLQTTTDSVEEALKEIRFEHESVAIKISEALASSEARREAVISALSEDRDLPVDLPNCAAVVAEAADLATQIEARIKTLRATAAIEMRTNLSAEAQELRARKLLAANEQVVIEDIERRKKYAAYSACVEDTRTQAITAKSTAVSKVVVSQKLKQRFQDELVKLSFRHVEVELKELGGAEGISYHKLVLTRAPGVELPKVVSEGEQRCLSIAAFFAELATADDPSGIVFDDPVSSLDFQWRGSVARRLVEEAKTRQVIVFTHDVVFLLALRQYAEQVGIEPKDQHVKQLSKGAGVCADELPWVALPIRKKLGFLKNGWQAVDKLLRDGNQDAYEKEAKYLYGLLREGWERALEEVLFAGVVERYRPGIQTQQIALVADITSEDCKAVETAMTKCSAWLTGHDQAAAARAPVPGSGELKADIEALDIWVSAIRRRREKRA